MDMGRHKKDASEVERAISAYIMEHGVDGVTALHKNFPDMPYTSFWRLVKKKREDFHDLSKSAPDAATAAVMSETRRAATLLPMVTPAAVVTQGASQTRARLDVMDQLGKAAQMADDLDAFSRNAEGKIKSPQIGERSASLRIKIATAHVSVAALYADVRRMDAFYTAVIDEVGKVSVEAQRAIIDRLHALNQEFGMTAAAAY